MTSPNPTPAPAYSVLLEPHLTSQADVPFMRVHLSLSKPNKKPGEALYVFETRFGNVDAHRYEESDLIASDGAGPLPIEIASPDPDSEHSQQPNLVEWRVTRRTEGDVKLSFKATPRQVDRTTPLGPRVDLRCDQDGMIGGARWFLPRPILALGPDEDTFRLRVQWDLSHTPPDTRAAWTFGEGPDPIDLEQGTMEMIYNCIFMVGAIKSLHQPHSAVEPCCATYWFGEVPRPIANAMECSHKIFSSTARLFQDHESRYRIFIRRSPAGFGGSSFASSYLLEYSDDAKEKPSHEIVHLLTHEMFHNWVWMFPELDGQPNLWFIEGIAEFYSLFLPVRFRLQDPSYFCRILNQFLAAYYTTPYPRTEVKQAEIAIFQDSNAEINVYMRGFMYFLLVDGFMRGDTTQLCLTQNPLDKQVVEFSRQLRDGSMLRSQDWHDLLDNDPNAAQVRKVLDDMSNGEVLSLDSFVHSAFSLDGCKIIIEPTKQNQLQLGFDTASLRTKVVTGIIPGSRAELSGLQNGDRLLSHTQFSTCVRDYSKKFEFEAQRGSTVLKGIFWPRSFLTASSYQAIITSSSPTRV